VKGKKSWEVLLTRRQALRVGGILVASSWMGPNLAWGEGETREGRGIVVALEGRPGLTEEKPAWARVSLRERS